MAESASTRRQAGAPGTSSPAPPEAHDAGQARPSGPDMGPESRPPGQELTVPGIPAAASAPAHGREAGRGWSTQLEQQVREQPLAALLLAAGLGLLLGLLRRR
jgi:hypothetical protein